MEFIITDSNKCKTFVTIFQNIKSFCESFNIMITEEKLYIQSLDSSHVLVLEVSLNNDWFNSFNVKNNITLGINSSILNKIISTWSPNLSIKFDIENPDSEKLNISFENMLDKEIDNEYSKYFQIPLVDIDTEHLCIPDTEYTADITISSSKFKKIIDELSIIGDTIQFTCNENMIRLDTTSLEGSMCLNINIDEESEEYAIEENCELKSSYKIKYIKNIVVFQKISSQTTLHISNDIPIQIYHSIDDNSFIRFFLAPQIDD